MADGPFKEVCVIPLLYLGNPKMLVDCILDGGKLQYSSNNLGLQWHSLSLNIELCNQVYVVLIGR